MATRERKQNERAERLAKPEPVIDAGYRQLMHKADEVDRRRRIQVDAQRQVINRLLENRGWRWQQEQATLLAELVEANAKLEAVTDYVTGMKYSNVARKVCDILGEVVEMPKGDDE